jgi:hypothetical protein
MDPGMNCWDKLGRGCSPKEKLPAFRWQPASSVSAISRCAVEALHLRRETLNYHPIRMRGLVFSSFFTFFKVFFAMILPPRLGYSSRWPHLPLCKTGSNVEGKLLEVKVLKGKRLEYSGRLLSSRERRILLKFSPRRLKSHPKGYKLYLRHK